MICLKVLKAISGHIGFVYVYVCTFIETDFMSKPNSHKTHQVGSSPLPSVIPQENCMSLFWVAGLSFNKRNVFTECAKNDKG